MVNGNSWQRSLKCELTLPRLKERIKGKKQREKCVEVGDRDNGKCKFYVQ